jgi:hypothetical protein
MPLEEDFLLQNQGIVPMQQQPPAFGIAKAQLDANCMAARTAGGDLIKQLR